VDQPYNDLLYIGEEKSSFSIGQPFSLDFKGGEKLGVWRDVLGDAFTGIYRRW